MSRAGQKLLAEDAANFQFAVNCGDDYEILGSVSKKNLPKLRAALHEILIPVTTIGVFVAVDGGVEFVDDNEKALSITLGGYSHSLTKAETLWNPPPNSA
jgi:thiamine monophosphate kinase